MDDSISKSQKIYADDILKKVKQGQDIDYNDKVIIGDLDLDKIKLPKINIRYSEWIYDRINRDNNKCIKSGENANFITSKI